MTPLLAHLLAGGPTGIRRIDEFDRVQEDLARSFDRSVLVVELVADDSAAIFAEFAGRFSFPEWFGRNWDALYDSLLDLPPERWPDLTVIHLSQAHSPEAARNITVLADVVADVVESRGGGVLFVGPKPADIALLEATIDPGEASA